MSKKIGLFWLRDDFRITKTAEIPLVKSGISRIVEHKKGKDTHGVESTERLKLLTIGQGVGRSSTAVMIDQDKVIIFGGLQEGAAYSPSNKVHLIDFSDSFKPVVTEINSMYFSRSYGDSTILPNGKVFLNGGHSYNDLEFSNFIPEIYVDITSFFDRKKSAILCHKSQSPEKFLEAAKLMNRFRSAQCNAPENNYAEAYRLNKSFPFSDIRRLLPQEPAYRPYYVKDSKNFL